MSDSRSVRPLIFAAHGTRDPRGQTTIATLCEMVAARLPGVEVRLGWVDVIEPTLASVIVDDAVLVHSWVEDGVLKFELWSTKRYDEVKSLKSPRRKIVPPRTIEDASPTCQSQVPVPGFEVTITRQMIKGGQVVKTDGFVTSYTPQDKVRCTGPVKGQTKRT